MVWIASYKRSVSLFFDLACFFSSLGVCWHKEVVRVSKPFYFVSYGFEKMNRVRLKF